MLLVCILVLAGFAAADYQIDNQLTRKDTKGKPPDQARYQQVKIPQLIREPERFQDKDVIFSGTVIWAGNERFQIFELETIMVKPLDKFSDFSTNPGQVLEISGRFRHFVDNRGVKVYLVNTGKGPRDSIKPVGDQDISGIGYPRFNISGLLELNREIEGRPVSIGNVEIMKVLVNGRAYRVKDASSERELVLHLEEEDYFPEGDNLTIQGEFRRGKGNQDGDPGGEWELNVRLDSADRVDHHG